MKYARYDQFWRRLLLIALLVLLVPILWIAFFDHSCYDDYSNGFSARMAWVGTHDLFSVLLAALYTVKGVWLHWQGTFTSIFMFALQPAVFGENYYFITAYILSAFLIAGTFLFFRKLLHVRYGRKAIGDILACVVSILSIELMPSPAEGLYWNIGGVYYTLSYGVMLMIFSRYLTIFYTYEKNKWYHWLWTAILAFLLCGTNYVTSLLTIEVTALLFLYALCTKQKYRNGMLWVLLAALVAFAINALAPGNSARQAVFVRDTPWHAIKASFEYAALYAKAWTRDSLLLPMLFMVPFFIQLRPREGRTSFKGCLSALVLMYLLFASSFTPTIFAGMGSGGIGPDRVQNIRFFMWIVVCFIAEMLAIEMAVALLSKLRFLGDKVRRVCMAVTLALPCVALLLAAPVALRNVRYSVDSYTTTSAMVSLQTGEAKEYDNIFDRRMKVYLSDEKNPVMEPLTVRPHVLFYSDIKEDPKHEINYFVALFFQKESVRLAPDPAARE